MRKRLVDYVGLSGVSEEENNSAKRWGRYFNILMMGAVVWLMFQWHYEFTGQLTVFEAWYGNFVVWCFFVSETTFLTLLVDDKKRYLCSNWLNIVIITIGIPLLLIDYGPNFSILRALRFIFVIGLIIPWVGLSLRFLTDNRLDTTLLAGLVILLLAAVLIVDIDPNIHTIREGFWWAWVTISTVGYGDVVPTSTLGRLFASLLILFGLALFSIITANFAAIFIQADNKKKTERINALWEENFQHLNEIKQREAMIEQQINDLSLKLHRLESNQCPSFRNRSSRGALSHQRLYTHPHSRYTRDPSKCDRIQGEITSV